MSEQITLLVTGKAKPEHCNNLKGRLVHFAQLSCEEPGNIDYCLRKVNNSQYEFFLYKNWVNQEALNIHMQKDCLKEFLNDCSFLLEGKLIVTRASIFK